MLSFGQLVYNEWLKMSKKRSFLIAYAAILICIAAVGYLIVATAGDEMPTVLEFMSIIMAKSGIGVIVTIIAIIFTAGVVSKEHQLGTIKFLLIRAHSRSKILASKYITVLLFTCSLIIFSAIVAGTGGFIVFDHAAGDHIWQKIAQAALYQFIYTGIYVTLTFMFGVITRSSGATIGIGMTAVLLEGILSMLLSGYDFSKYLLFMNTDLSIYASSGPPMEGMTFSFSSVVAAAYVLLFLAASFVTFKKRDIA